MTSEIIEQVNELKKTRVRGQIIQAIEDALEKSMDTSKGEALSFDQVREIAEKTTNNIINIVSE
jgi:hypothetical protein